jgi:hypothetical protein
MRLEWVLHTGRGDSPAVARALTGLGCLAWAQEDHSSARGQLKESIAIGRRLGLDEDVGVALTFLSMTRLGQG